MAEQVDIVGMVGYLSQVSEPVSFLSSPSFPIILIIVWCDLSTNPLVCEVVGHGLQLLHAKDLAHFVDYTAHKVSTPVTQEPGQGSKDWDVTLIQELGDGFGCLIGGHICQYMLCEVVLEHQDISNFRWIV